MERIISIKRYKRLTPDEKLKELERKLDLLISRECYEEAAYIRDKINEIRAYTSK